MKKTLTDARRCRAR